MGIPWLAGSLFALNPLGDEGSVLPVTLTAVSGIQYAHGLVLPGLLFGLPIGVVAPSAARTVVAGLLGFVPAFLLGFLPGSDAGIAATAAGWFTQIGTELLAIDLGGFRSGVGGILLIGGVVASVLLYRNAIHRFQRYSPR